MPMANAIGNRNIMRWHARVRPDGLEDADAPMLGHAIADLVMPS